LEVDDEALSHVEASDVIFLAVESFSSLGAMGARLEEILLLTLTLLMTLNPNP